MQSDRRKLAPILVACALTAAAAFAGVAGPLEIHPTNPRYLTDGSGKVVLLVGSHDWNVFQDYVGPRDCPRHRLPFPTFIRNLVDWGHSFTRGSNLDSQNSCIRAFESLQDRDHQINDPKKSHSGEDEKKQYCAGVFFSRAPVLLNSAGLTAD